ncbi:hypothetical protein CYMTET_26607 [Cymbomonas tetramitiformis]|uniref:RING-type E3 ubiquitin transferase n=1 Tax=Cymbomonas tetramitiformis TaxID=36881 RepID=A0AAE0FSZ5_9CHLO|nr:hypothetical protein CYMTET_26607 [Cymbomonas tetramitiformis]
MTNRILCKYYASGACRKGDACPFSHDWNDPMSQVCKFYLLGSCGYGNRCRYNHTRPDRATVGSPSSPVGFRNIPVASRPSPQGTAAVSPASAAAASPPPPLASPGFCMRLPENFDDELGWGEVPEEPEVDVGYWAKQPLCSMAMKGFCARGATCPYLHGELCSSCGKWCLHPYRPEESAKHAQRCAEERAKKDKDEALRRSSADVECGICLEQALPAVCGAAGLEGSAGCLWSRGAGRLCRLAFELWARAWCMSCQTVMGKERKADRRFGILTACDHSFCLGCIRGWRAGATTNSAEEVTRSCPICRTRSHFIVPSTFWVSCADDKEALVQNYREKLAMIPCKHFNYGNGSCPFGGSCFYAHADSSGRPEEAQTLRHAATEDGVSVLQPVRLSSFLDGFDRATRLTHA